MKRSTLLILLLPMLLVPCHLHAMEKEKKEKNFLTKIFSIFSSKQEKKSEPQKMTQNHIEPEKQEKKEEKPKPKVVKNLRDKNEKKREKEKNIEIKKTHDWQRTVGKKFEQQLPNLEQVFWAAQKNNVYGGKKNKTDDYTKQKNLVSDILNEKIPENDLSCYADDEYSSDDEDEALKEIMDQIDEI